tara:strand:+ start:1337 stop:1990 length:654 start_codon:yes stop_codon:yes gene_type:complete
MVLSFNTNVIAYLLIAASVVLVGCGSESISADSDAIAVDPESSGVIEGVDPSMMWMLDSPETPRELFAFRCRIAAERFGYGYEWTETPFEVNYVNREKITAVSRWKVPRDPEANEAAICQVIIDTTDVNDDEYPYVYGHGLSGRFDFAQKSDELSDLMESAKEQSPVARKIDGVWVIASFDPNHERGTKTFMEWTFQNELPSDLEVTLKPDPITVRE